MRVLITGADGFVGRHLVVRLREIEPGSVIVATGRSLAKLKLLDCTERLAMDVADAGVVDTVVARVKPDAVFHLAGIAAIQQASAHAAMAWDVHVRGSLNVAASLLRYKPDCTMLFAGSGQVYGMTAQAGGALDETALLAPTNDYAVTKAAADLALGALAFSMGLRVVRFRPFNHTGPGQSEAFVVPGFAAQIARIEAGLQPPVIRVGNLDAQRDFLDVRDVVEAYAGAMTSREELAPGLILNIASGVPRSVRGILDKLCALSRVPVQVEVDSARMRPSEIPKYFGNASRAMQVLNWAPRYDIDATIAAILDDWRDQITRNRSS